MRRRDRSRRDVLFLAQPAGLVVDGGDGTVGKVEAPCSLALTSAGSEGQHDGPRTVICPPGVPDDLSGVDATALEPLGHPRGERGRAAAAGSTVARAKAGTAREACDVLAFGKNGSLVTVDLLDRPPCTLGGLFSGGAGPDQGLDIAGTQATVRIDRQSPQSRPIVPDRCPQRLVDRHSKTRALGSAEQEVLTVLMNADKLQVLHCHLLSRPTTQTLPSSTAETADATPQR